MKKEREGIITVRESVKRQNELFLHVVFAYDVM